MVIGPRAHAGSKDPLHSLLQSSVARLVGDIRQSGMCKFQGAMDALA